MHRDHHAVRLKIDGDTETLSIEYEPEFGENTKDYLASDSNAKEDIGEHSQPSDIEGLALKLGETKAICV